MCIQQEVVYNIHRLHEVPFIMDPQIMNGKCKQKANLVCFVEQSKPKCQARAWHDRESAEVERVWFVIVVMNRIFIQLEESRE